MTENATAYLKTLNSCICNLRDEAVPGLGWNRSVQGGYDPRKWCFVNTAFQVTSDETGVQNLPVPSAAYPAFAGKPTPTRAGFYLTDPFDEYLLGRLFDHRIVRLLEKSYLYIYHGMDAAGNAVMASSSNAFPVVDWKPDFYGVYFEREGAWQPF